MALGDIHAGHGVTFIDPHGTAADAILDRIPYERTNDIQIIDPTETRNVISLNPFENVPEEQYDLVAENFIEMARHLWGDSWGPLLENILRHTLHALLSAPQDTRPSVLSIPILLNPKNKTYRRRVIANSKNEEVRRFFADDFGSWSDRLIHERTQSVLNKMQQLATSDHMRFMLGPTSTSFRLRDAIRKKSIVIVRLPKGKLGATTVKLLGSIVVTTMQHTAMQQDPRSNPTPHFLYMDEFKNFVTQASADGLSELRKYKLAITAAAQYTKQLPDGVLDAIFGNVGTIISFRVIDQDAKRLAAALGDYREDAYTGLSQGEVVCRTIYGSDVHGPFPARVHLPEHENFGLAEIHKKEFRQRSTVTRKHVSRRLAKWARKASFEPLQCAQAKTKPPAKTRRKIRKPHREIIGTGGHKEVVFNPDTNTVVTRLSDTPPLPNNNAH